MRRLFIALLGPPAFVVLASTFVSFLQVILFLLDRRRHPERFDPALVVPGILAAIAEKGCQSAQEPA